MTVSTVVAGLLPIMWSTRVGAEVMKPLATPVLGGMVSSLLHVLIVTPVHLLLAPRAAARTAATSHVAESTRRSAACDRVRSSWPLVVLHCRGFDGRVAARAAANMSPPRYRRVTSCRRSAAAIWRSRFCRRPARCTRVATRSRSSSVHAKGDLVDVGAVRASANMAMPGMVMSGDMRGASHVSWALCGDGGVRDGRRLAHGDRMDRAGGTRLGQLRRDSAMNQARPVFRNQHRHGQRQPRGAQEPVGRNDGSLAPISIPAGGLTLEDAIARALEREPSLRAARTQIDVARGCPHRRRSSGRTRRSRFRSNRSQVAPIARRASNCSGRSISIRKSARVAVADREIDAAHQATANQERALAADVRPKYGEVLTAHPDVVGDRGVAFGDQPAAWADRVRVEQGAAPPLDRDMLRVEEQKLEADRIAAGGRGGAAAGGVETAAGHAGRSDLTLRQPLEELVRERRRDAGASGCAGDHRRPMSSKPRRGSASRTRRSIARTAKDARTSVCSGCTCAWMRAFPSRGSRVRGRSNACGMCSITGPQERWSRCRSRVAIRENVAVGGGGTHGRRGTTRGGTVDGAERKSRRRDRVTNMPDRRCEAYSGDAIRFASQNLDVIRQTYELGRGTLFDVLNEQRRYFELEQSLHRRLARSVRSAQALKSRVRRSAMNGTSRVTLRMASRDCRRRWSCSRSAQGSRTSPMRPASATVGPAPVRRGRRRAAVRRRRHGTPETARAEKIDHPDAGGDAARRHRRRARHVSAADRHCFGCPASSNRMRISRSSSRRLSADGSRASWSNWRERPARTADGGNLQSRSCGGGDAIRLGTGRTRCARARAPANAEARRDRRRKPSGTRNAACGAHREADGAGQRANASRTARAIRVIDQQSRSRKGPRRNRPPCRRRLPGSSRSARPMQGSTSTRPRSCSPSSICRRCGSSPTSTKRTLSHVRVGTPANVTTKAFPDLALSGRVSYIDPQVHPETRTVKVRVEVPNARQELRLGMFADVSIETAGRGRRRVFLAARCSASAIGRWSTWPTLSSQAGSSSGRFAGRGHRERRGGS